MDFKLRFKLKAEAELQIQPLLLVGFAYHTQVLHLDAYEDNFQKTDLLRNALNFYSGAGFEGFL